MNENYSDYYVAIKEEALKPHEYISTMRKVACDTVNRIIYQNDWDLNKFLLYGCEAFSFEIVFSIGEFDMSTNVALADTAMCANTSSIYANPTQDVTLAFNFVHVIPDRAKRHDVYTVTFEVNNMSEFMCFTNDPLLERM